MHLSDVAACNLGAPLLQLVELHLSCTILSKGLGVAVNLNLFLLYMLIIGTAGSGNMKGKATTHADETKTTQLTVRLKLRM